MFEDWLPVTSAAGSLLFACRVTVPVPWMPQDRVKPWPPATVGLVELKAVKIDRTSEMPATRLTLVADWLGS